MSLAKKVQREIKTNPAKAAGLVVLLLIAGYFWGPLLKGYFGSVDAPTSPTVAGNPMVTTTEVKPAAPSEPAFDWQSYAQSIDSDPRMRPSAELPAARDPFQANTPPAIEVVAEDDKTVDPPSPASISPAEAGVTLETTLIGARVKIAQIGGKSYRIGDFVKAASGDLHLTFRLVDIRPRLVVLERDGKRYALKIPRPLMDALDKEDNDDESTVARHGANTTPQTGDTSHQESETRSGALTD